MKSETPSAAEVRLDNPVVVAIDGAGAISAVGSGKRSTLSLDEECPVEEKVRS
jgi:hypothetical protein